MQKLTLQMHSWRSCLPPTHSFAAVFDLNSGKQSLLCRAEFTYAYEWRLGLVVGT